MRYIQDIGAVHENATPAFVALLKERLTLKLAAVPSYQHTQWGTTVHYGFEATVYNDRLAWGSASGLDPEAVILEAVADYEKNGKGRGR